MKQQDRDQIAKLTARRDQLQELMSDVISRMHEVAVLGMHYTIMDMNNRDKAIEMIRDMPEGMWEALMSPLMSLGCIIAHIGAIEKEMFEEEESES